MMDFATHGSGVVDAPYLLEAHYYEGGLRGKLLGGRPDRPSWVPPIDYVGFRNETPLGPDEAVVEFARFAYDNRAVTWIGVSQRSADQVFGDRQNHASAGVWLRDLDIVNPAPILRGLLQFAEAVAARNMDQAAEGARIFETDKHLGRYVRPRSAAPPQLSGWTFSRSPMSETMLFGATAATLADAVDAAAEQVLRMSVLPGPSPTCSRALILLQSPQASASSGAAAAQLQPVKRGLAADLLDYIPRALGDILEQNYGLTVREQTADERARRSEAAAAELQQKLDSLQQRHAQLEDQLADNEPLRRLSAIERMLNGMDNRLAVMDTSLRNMRAMDRETSSTRTRPQTASPAYAGQGGGAQVGGPGISYGFVAAVIAGVVLICALIYFFFIYVVRGPSEPEAYDQHPAAAQSVEPEYVPQDNGAPAQDAASPSENAIAQPAGAPPAQVPTQVDPRDITVAPR